MLKNHHIESEFQNWHVLQVRMNKEKFIFDTANRLLGNRVKIMLFMKEIIHTRNNQDVKWEIPLFPGYIFIHKDINSVTEILRSRLNNEFIKPITFGDRLAEVTAHEMEFLLSNSNCNGKILLSYGYKEGDTVRIIRGPLKDIKGKIEFINIKKRKAKISFILFQQRMDVSLGIDFINASNNNQ